MNMRKSPTKSSSTKDDADLDTTSSFQFTSLMRQKLRGVFRTLTLADGDHSPSKPIVSTRIVGMKEERK